MGWVQVPARDSRLRLVCPVVLVGRRRHDPAAHPGLGQDERFLRRRRRFHPTLFSNTYFFYLNGWSGINIEARPGSKALFDRVRPRDVNVEVGVSRERGALTYYLIAEDSTMNSFSRDFLQQIDMLQHVKSEIPVPTMPLAEILERHVPSGQSIRVSRRSCLLNDHGYELCAQNVIILDKINEYFLIDRMSKR